jgi:hypothetical protein
MMKNKRHHHGVSYNSLLYALAVAAAMLVLVAVMLGLICM